MIMWGNNKRGPDQSVHALNRVSYEASRSIQGQSHTTTAHGQRDAV